MRGHNYLRENAITNWASPTAPRNRIQVAQSDARTDPRPSNDRCDPRLSNTGGEQEQRDDSPLFLPGLSSSLSDVSNAEEGYQGSIGASPSPVADHSETQSQSKINIQKASKLSAHRADTEYNNVRKRRAPSHEEDSQPLSKKAHQTFYALAFLKGIADRNVLDHLEEEKDRNVLEELEEEKAHEEERAMEFHRSDSALNA